jgi:PAP2 superfamily
MASANSFIADWDAKFTYNFWRPVTAIRNGDQDGNDATERDVAWTPLVPTPMHPEYPSQAAISAGVMMGVMEALFGPNPALPITIADPADPKRTRTLNGIAQMAEEHNNVRVWGGIHFRNSLVVATEMGRKIAAYMVENAITPTR